MLHTCIVSSLRSLARMPFHAGITILGLAVSFAAVIFIAVFLRDERSYDTFIPGHRDVYRLEARLPAANGGSTRYDMTPATAAAALALDFPVVRAVARLTPSQSTLRRDAVEASDRVLWADAALFAVLPLTVVEGDLSTALRETDGVVLTRAMARKYFGAERVVGRTLEINPGLDNLPGLSAAEAAALGSFHAMHVRAVIEDLPDRTHLSGEIFAASGASFSPMNRWERVDTAEVFTYLRLPAGAERASVDAGLRQFGRRHFPRIDGKPQSGWDFQLQPLAAIHLAPAGVGAMKPSGDRGVDSAIAAVGLLLAGIAAINFIVLVTARSARRAVEVGVRKTAGAHRSQLVAQFMGETFVHVLLALVLAAALAEWLGPQASAFLQRALRVGSLTDPLLLAALLLVAVAVGGLASFYPALVLSAFRPAIVLKGAPIRAGGSGRARQWLVVFQFAVLIGLTIMTATIYRQSAFALKGALRLDTRQVMTLFAPCSPSFLDELKVIRGVRTAACTSSPALNRRAFPLDAALHDGTPALVQGAPVGPGFFELQSIPPVAGRLFSEARGEDVSSVAQPSLILNETAVTRLGFRSPQEAVGRTISWSRRRPGSLPNQSEPMRPSTIVGVIPDYSLGSVRTAIEPTLYYVDPEYLLFVAVKLEPEAGAATLAAIDALWKRTGHPAALQRSFEDQFIANLYRDVLAQASVMLPCSALAMFIACLGLLGMSSLSTERRTREIGLRKALGASTADIVRLFLWSFAKPVLVANLIAWPVAWWAMDRWLAGFIYHVDLPMWLFLAAGVGAALVALATVSINTVLVARASPIGALRYS